MTRKKSDAEAASNFIPVAYEPGAYLRYRNPAQDPSKPCLVGHLIDQSDKLTVVTIRVDAVEMRLWARFIHTEPCQYCPDQQLHLQLDLPLP